jgi:hypothetical protein
MKALIVVLTGLSSCVPQCVPPTSTEPVKQEPVTFDVGTPAFPDCPGGTVNEYGDCKVDITSPPTTPPSDVKYDPPSPPPSTEPSVDVKNDPSVTPLIWGDGYEIGYTCDSVTITLADSWDSFSFVTVIVDGALVYSLWYWIAEEDETWRAGKVFPVGTSFSVLVQNGPATRTVSFGTFTLPC